MARGFLDIAGTPSVKAAQAANGVVMRSTTGESHAGQNRFTVAEAQFIAARDSFYLASVSETGWPYVQHRGGPPGFLRVIDDSTLAFADFRGNRQYISLGNVTANDRVAPLLMDYANRRRLKIYARIEAKDLKAEPQTAETLALPGYRAKPERLFLLHLEALAWNCPQHITPRFTEREIAAALEPVRARIAQLEAENKMLRNKLGIAKGEGMPNADRLPLPPFSLESATEKIRLAEDAWNTILKDISDKSTIQEFWITDSAGHAYLTNTGIDFTFSADPAKQPQASAFWRLIDGTKKVVIQEAKKREIDSKISKYVGVAGVDKRRIVQVGVAAGNLVSDRRLRLLSYIEVFGYQDRQS